MTYDEPVLALDLLPTALAAAGVQPPPKLDGVDLMPRLLGIREGAPREALYWRVCGGAGWAVRRGEWKLVKDVSMGSAELYDLDRDVGEDQDLSAARPDVVRHLTRLYEEWSSALREPVWSDGHAESVAMERSRARDAGARQFPCQWFGNGGD